LKSTETISNFLADFLYLISQTNCTIPETETIYIILEVISPEYYNTVGNYYEWWQLKQLGY